MKKNSSVFVIKKVNTIRPNTFLKLCHIILILFNNHTYKVSLWLPSKSAPNIGIVKGAELMSMSQITNQLFIRPDKAQRFFNTFFHSLSWLNLVAHSIVGLLRPNSDITNDKKNTTRKERFWYKFYCKTP